jgi:hypothetical protein
MEGETTTTTNTAETTVTADMGAPRTRGVCYKRVPSGLALPHPDETGIVVDFGGTMAEHVNHTPNQTQHVSCSGSS